MAHKAEILAPCGSFETLEAALRSGCDAVYLGGEKFSARQNATNFTDEQLKEAVRLCHLRGVKVYQAINTVVFDEQLEECKKAVKFAAEIGVDGLITQDLTLVKICRECCPDLEYHASTQMTIHSESGVKMAKNLGFSRAVLSRELPEHTIKDLTALGIETEVFVHGALCMSVSGQCYMSAVIGSRSANRGLCAQACRLPAQGDKITKGQERYALSLKDMSYVDKLQRLEKDGVSSLKIEGRMKTALYVATVARTYRKAIDDYLESEEKYRQNMPWYLEQISNCTYRQFTTGFFFGKPSEETQIYDSNTYVKEYTYLGIVGEQNAQGLYRIEQRNKFSVGEEIEVMKPNGDNIPVTVKAIQDEEGTPMESAPHPKQVLYIDLGHTLEKFDILRRQEKEEQ